MIITPDQISLSTDETFDLLYSVNRNLWEQVLDTLSDAVQEIYEKETGLEISVIDDGVHIEFDSINYYATF